MMKSALVHDWLSSAIGGGENVLKEIHQLLPSPIFTLLANKNELQNSYFKDLEIHTSFIQHLPFAHTKYRNYLPLFPKAIESFDLSDFDLILSSSHCVAKGIKKRADQLHICYCHTPMRYAWDLMDHYLNQANIQGLKKLFARAALNRLRTWDTKTTARVDYFIANSKYVASRINNCYNRDATVIYPPVNTHLFELEEKKDSYYISTSRLVQNKRVDLIVEAFNQMPTKKLLIIGEGPEREKLEQMASKNITFLGKVTIDALKKYLQNAKGFVFASIEDFGIAPVEAMACGTPVIALGQGGALESVIPHQTGIFFQDQTVTSLIQGIQKFESLEIDPRECRARAEQFSLDIFRKKYQAFVIDKCIDANMSNAPKMIRE